MFPLAIALALRKGPLARLAAATVGAVVLALTLGTLGEQISEPVHWSIAFRQIDAAASAFFIPVDDEETRAGMYPAAEPRDRLVESLRALLISAPVGNNVYLALAWCAVIALAGYFWAQAAFRRRYRAT